MVKIKFNGVDAFARYGIFLTSGGFSALRKPAPQKAFIQNKSRIANGKQVVAKNPKVDERSVILPIQLTASSESQFVTRYDLFVSEVLEKGTFTLTVDSLPNVVFRLVYEDCQQYTEFIQETAKFVLKLTEPNPKNRGVEDLNAPKETE